MSSDGPRLLRVGIIAFVVALAVFLLVGVAIGLPSDHTVRHAVNEEPRAREPGVQRVTLDAQDAETHLAYSFAQGRRVKDAQADVKIRRYVLQAPHGALDLGPVAIEEARVAAGAAFAPDAMRKGELQNPALAEWYEYSYWTHRLTSRNHTYAVRTAAGGVAYVKLVGYYCAPEGAGCLTLDYRVEPTLSPAE